MFVESHLGPDINMLAENTYSKAELENMLNVKFWNSVSRSRCVCSASFQFTFVSLYEE